MILKQKIMMARQAALAREEKEKKNKEVQLREDEVSTHDESNGESPMSSPQRDLPVRAKVEDIKKTVKMEEEHSYVRQSPVSNCKKIRRSGKDKIQPKVEYESSSSSEKQGFKTHPTKNIFINYGKAMLTFATSHISIPYILEAIKNTNIDFQGFIVFVKANKNTFKSMTGLRSMIVVDKNDDITVAGYKKVFQIVCEVFLKYFSANWIIHSKLSYKMVYLKERSKMLRRVQNPDLLLIQINGCHSV